MIFLCLFILINIFFLGRLWKGKDYKLRRINFHINCTFICHDDIFVYNGAIDDSIFKIK
jgi:hypothetical protein